MTVLGELCCVTLLFCCVVVVALPFSESLGVIVHVYSSARIYAEDCSSTVSYYCLSKLKTNVRTCIYVRTTPLRTICVSVSSDG